MAQKPAEYVRPAPAEPLAPHAPSLAPCEGEHGKLSGGEIPPLPSTAEPRLYPDQELSFADSVISSYDRPVQIAYPVREASTRQTESPIERPTHTLVQDPASPAGTVSSKAVSEVGENVVEPAFVTARPEVAVRLIGEAFATYILLEADQELLLIDKHAAHERILFDRLMAQRARPQSQMLFDPVTVTLEKGEYSALLEHLDTVQQAGFDVSDFGSGTILVRAVPMEMQGGDVALLMQEIAGKFAEHQQEVSLDHLEWIYHSVACRAAVKAGDLSGTEELIALARRICADQSVMYCPHGRPVAIRLTKREIEKQFGRIQ